MGTRIEAARALASHGWREPTARRLADAAARECLARAGRAAGDVDLHGDRVAFTGEDMAGAYTAGPIAALEAAVRSGRLAEARTVLLLAADAGITVTLALYRQTPPV